MSDHTGPSDNQPQGQWPPQPQQAPGQGGGMRKSVLLAIVVVLVLVVGGVVAAVLLTGDDDSDDGDSSSAGSPAGTVEEVISALEAGDCDAAREHAPDLDDATCAGLEPEGFEYGSVTEREVEGDRATVEVVIESPATGDSIPVEVQLTNEDGDWIVSEWADPRQDSPAPCSDDAPACTPDPSPTGDPSPTPDPSAGDDTDALKAEILAVAQADVDALAGRDCAALRETTWAPDTDCAGVFADIPANTDFGELHVAGGGDDVFVQVDLVVDGKSLPRGLQLSMMEDDERGWVVSDWQYFT